jgi:hypothetical protein
LEEERVGKEDVLWQNASELNFAVTNTAYKSRGSSVGIALGYGLDDWSSRVRFPTGTGNVSLHHRVQNCFGATQPHINWVPGTPSLGVKRSGREADHSPPSSAEAKECVELYLHSTNTP